MPVMAKAGKVKLIAKSVRLPPDQVEFIDLCLANGLFGANESDVVRTLITYAMTQMDQHEIVKKRLEALGLLKRPN